MVYSSDKKLCLVDNGLPESVIVIANNSKGCVPAATERLVEGIKKITGCELPVVKISEENFDSVKQKIAGKVPILLGQSAWTREMHLVPPEGCDAFTIKILPDMVVIVGNDNQQFGMNFNITPTSSGTFYGVTKFLEMQGMRFYSSQSYGQIIPSNKTITVKQQDISEKPYVRVAGGYGAVRLVTEEIVTLGQPDILLRSYITGKNSLPHHTLNTFALTSRIV
jgi:hypothetical protein